MDHGMIVDHQTAIQVATVAVWTAWATGAALTLAILGAACEAMWPGSPTWVAMGLISGLLGLLRLISLIVLATLAWRLLVTYAHIGRGRHGLVKRGEHRPGVAGQRKASARTYTHRTV